MKNFAIIFGKDPEEIGGLDWPENYEDSNEFDEQFVSGKFETDSEGLFWQMFINVRLHPCSMWYWVIYNKEQIVAGAIDPDDIEIIAEFINVPQWVLSEIDMMDASWDGNKYGDLYNKLHTDIIKTIMSC